MATRAKTDATTKTMARNTLIGHQARVMMGRLTNEDPAFIEEVVSCLLDKAVSGITFCAMDGCTCLAKVSMEVDWDLNEFKISNGEDMVEVRGDGDLVETREMVRSMLDFVKGTSCRIDVIYTSPRDRLEETCKRLGTSPCNMPGIDGDKVSLNSSPLELEEITYRLEVRS